MKITTAYRLETERLVLRCWQPTDALMLKTAIDMNLEHLRPWMPWALKEPTSLDDKIESLRRWRGQFDLGQDFVFGIFNQAETEVIGGCGLHTRVEPTAREIGYWVSVAHINQGFATELSAALTRFAFLGAGKDRVEIRCDPRNRRSFAVPKKLGFTHEATLARRLKDSEDLWRDVMIWTMFASQFAASPASRFAVRAFDVVGREITWPDGEI